MKFRGGTGFGGDWLRPRHAQWLAEDALDCSGMLLMRAERLRRWLAEIRHTCLVALAKKGGGCRLIGLTVAVYRTWAQMRHCDCRVAVEAKLKRPFFAAAPRRGATDATFDAALLGEVATAKGVEAACKMKDLKQFYENIEVTELYTGARQCGLCLKSLR